jgi:serine/threonine protein kinase
LGRCDHCGAAVTPGGWSLLELLAKGPASRVYLAERDGRRVALKELLYATVPSVTELEAFEREGALLAQLEHPAIPRFVERFSEGTGVHTRLYLAQQYVPGESLEARLKTHRFDEPEVRRLADEVLGILEWLEGRAPPVVHRDVKPANLLQRPDGSLALVDFGAARDLRRGATHHATLVGTFGYMPPEQFGGTIDGTTDVYALGASLLHLLTRRTPDTVMSPEGRLDVHAASISAPFRDWLAKATARERAARFQSAAEAREALRRLGEETVAAAPLRSRGPAIGAAILVGLATFLGALLFALAGPTHHVSPPVSATPLAPAVKTVRVYTQPGAAEIVDTDHHRALGQGTVALSLKPDTQLHLEVSSEGYVTRWVTLDETSSDLLVTLEPLPVRAPPAPPVVQRPVPPSRPQPRPQPVLPSKPFTTRLHTLVEKTPTLAVHLESVSWPFQGRTDRLGVTLSGERLAPPPGPYERLDVSFSLVDGGGSGPVSALASGFTGAHTVELEFPTNEPATSAELSVRVKGTEVGRYTIDLFTGKVTPH